MPHSSRRGGQSTPRPARNIDRDLKLAFDSMRRCDDATDQGMGAGGTMAPGGGGGTIGPGATGAAPAGPTPANPQSCHLRMVFMFRFSFAKALRAHPHKGTGLLDGGGARR